MAMHDNEINDKLADTGHNLKRVLNYFFSGLPKGLENDYDAKRIFRREKIKELLRGNGLSPQEQTKHNFTNIICSFGENSSARERVIVSCHYDVATKSPGANDNTSSVVVCLELAWYLQELPLSSFTKNIEIIFFDGEERHKIGSKFYCREKEKDLREIPTEVINLEAVGIGEIPIVWPVKREKNQKLAEKIKQIDHQTVFAPQPGNITSDHESFLKMDVPALTLTMAKEQDVKYLASFFQKTILDGHIFTWNITEKFRTFTSFLRNYHRPTDTPDTLQIESLKKTLDLIKNLLYSLGAIHN